MNAHQPHWTFYLPFVILAVVLALRLRSMSRERPLNPGALWIVPAIYVFLAGSMLFMLPPPLVGWALAAAGLLIGIGLGWYRGRLIHVWRNDKGELRQKSSPVAMLLLLLLIVIKFGARAIFGETAAAQPGSGAMLMTDAFLGFALGLLTATRVEIYIRARRFLAAT